MNLVTANNTGINKLFKPFSCISWSSAETSMCIHMSNANSRLSEHVSDKGFYGSNSARCLGCGCYAVVLTVYVAKERKAQQKKRFCAVSVNCSRIFAFRLKCVVV